MVFGVTMPEGDETVIVTDPDVATGGTADVVDQMTLIGNGSFVVFGTINDVDDNVPVVEVKVMVVPAGITRLFRSVIVKVIVIGFVLTVPPAETFIFAPPVDMTITGFLNTCFKIVLEGLATRTPLNLPSLSTLPEPLKSMKGSVVIS